MRPAFIAAAAVAVLAIVTQASDAYGATRDQNVTREAHHVIRDMRVHVPWDGRYSHSHRRFCVETFNGSRHDIRQYGHGVPPGFYVKFCSDGNYYVNDGAPFKGMEAY